MFCLFVQGGSLAGLYWKMESSLTTSHKKMWKMAARDPSKCLCVMSQVSAIVKRQ